MFSLQTVYLRSQSRRFSLRVFSPATTTTTSSSSHTHIEEKAYKYSTTISPRRDARRQLSSLLAIQDGQQRYSERINVRLPALSFGALHTHSRRLTTITEDDDYLARKDQFGLASKVDVARIANEAVFLDVRGQNEVEEEALVGGYNVVHVQCFPKEGGCDDLVSKASELLPDKQVPIVIFCGIGGRASFAKAALESLGYEHVVNAGGLMDLGYLKKSK
mmetsp:Transcript_7181/g.10576  ORF Transcript_7181/g.10576 Transcript_7181/m.10576 type:complete len:219 (+) Transcript_7181:70-726(+)